MRRKIGFSSAYTADILIITILRKLFAVWFTHCCSFTGNGGQTVHIVPGTRRISPEQYSPGVRTVHPHSLRNIPLPIMDSHPSTLSVCLYRPRRFWFIIRRSTNEQDMETTRKNTLFQRHTWIDYQTRRQLRPYVMMQITTTVFTIRFSHAGGNRPCLR